MRVLVLFLAACAGGSSTDEPADDPAGEHIGDLILSNGFQMGVSVNTDWECVQDECPPADCDGNEAPVLGEPIYVVNGYASNTFGIGDDLQVLIPFSDADCNVGCGAARYGYYSPFSAMESEVGNGGCHLCSTEESGIYAGFGFITLEAGEYDAYAVISDGCRADSNRVEINFTL